jgi:hypothetical protein
MCGHRYVKYTYNGCKMTAMRRPSLRSSRGSSAGSLLEGCVDVRRTYAQTFALHFPSVPTVTGPRIGTGFSGSLL